MSGDVFSFGLFLGLTLFGFAIGALSGFFGIGGGAFLVPLLVRFGGLAWDQAIAISLAQMIPTGAIGAWRRWRQGETHLQLALLSLGGSIPGAWLGRQVVQAMGDRGVVEIAGFRFDLLDTGLSLIFTLFLWWMGRKMWRDAKRIDASVPQTKSEKPITSGLLPIPPHEAMLLGLGVGTTSALLGIGGGFLFVPVAVQRFGMPVSLAVGASLLQIPVTATVGAYLYLSVAGTPYLWLGPLLLGSSFGVVQGVIFSKRFDNQQLKRILAVLLLGVSVMVLTSWLRGLRGGH